MVFVDSTVSKISEYYFKPVVSSSPQEGVVFSDSEDETKIKSSSYMHIENHSTCEQKVSFVVYQHNIEEDYDCFFDIDYIYVSVGTDAEEVIEDGIIMVSAGETLSIGIDATARDSSKALISRGAPSVKVVILNN